MYEVICPAEGRRLLIIQRRFVARPSNRDSNPRGGFQMKRTALFVFAVLVFGSLSFAGSKTFSGVVGDSHCGIKHSTPGNSDCIEHCVSGGAKYVLISDDGNVYLLNAQDHFKGLGGKRVTVKGTLDGSTIAVKNVAQK